MKKRTNKYFGGPGIRTQVPMINTQTPWPSELHASFVIKTTRNYYISKPKHMPKKNINARFLKRANRRETRQRLLRLSLVIYLRIFIRRKLRRFFLKLSLGFKNSFQDHGWSRLHLLITPVPTIVANFSCTENA